MNWKRSGTYVSRHRTAQVLNAAVGGTDAAASRQVAEEQVNAILRAYDDPTLALLWTMLKADNWSTERATLVLRRAGWARS